MENNLRPKERFSGLAEDYAKARPNYSEEAIDFVFEHCNLKPRDQIVDIGCGTGIASRAFASKGLEVIGIEPNADMRRQAELANMQLAGLDLTLPSYQKGSAEQTGLPDNCCKTIIVAQAFHWFDGEKSLPEFVRILKSGGRLVLIWNLFEEAHCTTKDYCELIRKYGDADRLNMAIEAGMERSAQKLLESTLFLIKKNSYLLTNSI